MGGMKHMLIEYVELIARSEQRPPDQTDCFDCASETPWGNLRRCYDCQMLLEEELHELVGVNGPIDEFEGPYTPEAILKFWQETGDLWEPEDGTMSKMLKDETSSGMPSFTLRAVAERLGISE